MSTRKFKLIKEYPNSPKLGTIWNDYPCSSYSKEEFSEFWQEVKEQEFEVLAFFSKFGINTTFSNMFNLDFLPIYLNEGYKISKIKRLSDGEVFCVGDEVLFYHRICILESIYLNEHDQLSFKVNSTEAPKTGVFGTSKLQKAPIPLFVTEDGKNIYPGDISFGVRLSDFTINPVTHIDTTLYYPSGIKEFSTREKAKQFISENKPVYSKNQINKALMNSYSGYVYTPTKGVGLLDIDSFKKELSL